MRVSTSLFQAIRSFIVCLLFLSLHQPVTKNQIQNTNLLVLIFFVVVSIHRQKRHAGLFSFQITTTTTNIEKKKSYLVFGFRFLVTG